MNLGFSQKNCVLNRDAYLNMCVLKQESTVYPSGIYKYSPVKLIKVTPTCFATVTSYVHTYVVVV